jgi:hypothetical protein
LCGSDVVVRQRTILNMALINLNNLTPESQCDDTPLMWPTMLADPPAKGK